MSVTKSFKAAKVTPPSKSVGKGYSGFYDTPEASLVYLTKKVNLKQAKVYFSAKRFEDNPKNDPVTKLLARDEDIDMLRHIEAAGKAKLESVASKEVSDWSSPFSEYLSDMDEAQGKTASTLCAVKVKDKKLPKTWAPTVPDWTPTGEDPMEMLVRDKFVLENVMVSVVFWLSAKTPGKGGMSLEVVSLCGFESVDCETPSESA
ncbi:MAG: hypothetical protein COB04_16220 [Gammaproteobacteria bacterium]|nr:MAG: hypothetical protein COB04_16220 [Gammaproteobacteria bacterium]